MRKDSLIVKDMPDMILVCENLKVVLSGTYVQTKMNLSNQLHFQAKGKVKRRQLIHEYFIFKITVLCKTDLM